MSYTISILVIEDDKNSNTSLCNILSAKGYKVISTFTGQSALSTIAASCPDMILLNLDLPDMEGIHILQKVRAWSSTPILVVSSRTRESDKVLALDAGADDYITKPFGTEEFLARIRTALRHSNKLNIDSPLFIRPYQADDLVIDFEKHMIFLDSTPLHLTPVEYKILTYLAQNAGKVLTYHSIMQNVWGPYIDGDTKILRVNMANIRRKLEINHSKPHYIFTEVGIGYRMIEG